MDKVTASIIVPVYNAESYLEACIDSILRQTRKDFEVILVDDGSKDKSGAICDRYAEKDKRIRCIHQNNAGVSKARNVGLDFAQGNFVYFVDSDDEVESNLLEDTLPLMEKTDIDCLYFRVKACATAGEGFSLPIMYMTDQILKDGKARMDFILKHYLNCELQYVPFNKVYRREIIEQYNLRFDVGVAIGEDLAFGMKYLLCSDRVKGIDHILYQYWKREQSAMSAAGKENIRLNDFSNLLYGIKYSIYKEKIRSKDFQKIFIKTLDNQLIKRKKRDQFRIPVAEIEKKEFFLREGRKVLFHPFTWRRVFRNQRYFISRWLDLFYCLLQVRKGMEK